jgi:integrase
VTAWFTSEKEATQHKKVLEKKFAGIDATEDLPRAVALLHGTGITLLRCVEYALKHLKSGLEGQQTGKEACAAYLLWLKSKNRRKKTLSSYADKFREFEKTFGARIMSSITPDEFEKWLGETKTRGKSWSLSSQACYLRHLRPLFLRTEMPFPGAKWVPESEDSESVSFWGRREVIEKLLACPIYYRGNLAVAIFSGLRPATCAHLSPEWFDPVKKTIAVPGAFMKTRVDTTFTDVNDALWKWIAAFPVHKCNWKSLTEAIKAAGLKWSQDGARHTFATNLCSATDIETTRKALGHATQALVKKHYAGDQDQETSKAFFDLTPEYVYPGGDTTWVLPKGEPVSKYIPQAEGVKVAAQAA